MKSEQKKLFFIGQKERFIENDSILENMRIVILDVKTRPLISRRIGETDLKVWITTLDLGGQRS